MKAYPALGGKDFWSMVNGYWSMNGIQMQATQWVELLQDLTGRNDLSHLTMLPWKGIICGTDLMRKRLYFCVLCLQEQRKQVEYPNIPLLWCLSAVKTCPRHMVYLQDRCLNCLENVPIICIGYRPGHCRNCGGFIGSITNNFASKHAERSSRDHWITTHFAELIKNNMNPGNITRTTADDRKIFPIFKSNSTGRAKYMGIISGILKTSRHRIEAWENGRPLPFEFFLNISYELNLSPFRTYEFTGVKKLTHTRAFIKEFNENREELNRKVLELLKTKKSMSSLGAALSMSPTMLKKFYPDCYLYFITLLNEDQETIVAECLNEMKLALEDPSKLPTLTAIARKVGVSTQRLERIDPELSRSIVQKRRESGKKRQAEKIIRSQAAAIDCAMRLREMGLPITLRNLRLHLDQPGIMRIPDVYQAVNDYRSELEAGENSKSK